MVSQQSRSWTSPVKCSSLCLPNSNTRKVLSLLIKMDLSKLARPAILCQCSRCSSSLAALENNWAKLSNSYAIAAGWLSVELHRISISLEKKMVPQNSDMSLLRGRILQEISCKLCQQKLGVLCPLDDGPNIFWKVSKVSFREIVTMRTAEPLFKDGALELLIRPPQESKRESNALVPAVRNEVDTYNMSMEQQIQHQGLGLDHISNSVNNLYDTMSELKQSFTALRIELNSPGRLTSDIVGSDGNDFNMIRTVLKELKSKSDEIENLKLEIEALKLKNQYMEKQTARNSNSMQGVAVTLPEFQSPGLLQGNRKRSWPDSFPSGRTQPVADSFEGEEDGILADFSLADMYMQSVKRPLEEPEPILTANSSHEQTAPGSSRLHIEVATPHLDNTDDTHKADTDMQQSAVVKRPRISHSTDRPPSSANSDRKRPGRGRKSFSQTSKPDVSQTPKPTPLAEQNITISGDIQNERIPLNDSPSEPRDINRRSVGRPRTLRSRSRPPSARISGNAKKVVEEAAKSDTNNIQKNENASALMTGVQKNPSSRNEADAKLKGLVAVRDHLAHLAMQREEAMETEEA